VTDTDACTVCGEQAREGAPTSSCYSCGEMFHLNERNDTDGKDCGTVWIDEQFLALRFACQHCLDRDQQAERPKPQVRRPRVGQRRYRRRDV
jgi:hypothetical protein